MKTEILTALLLLLIIPSVSSISTDIEIKTLPRQTVFISIIQSSGNGETIQIIKAVSDRAGVAKAIFNNDNYNSFKVGLLVKEGEKITLPLKKFDTHTAGQLLSIEYLPEGFEPPEFCDSDHFNLCDTEDTCLSASGFWYDDICNSAECASSDLSKCTLDSSCKAASGFWYNDICNSEASPDVEGENVQDDVEDESNSGITGFATLEEGDNFISRNMYWFVGTGLFALIILLFVIKKYRTNQALTKGDEEPKIIKKIESEEREPNSEANERINRAEAKIREAQSELKQLKNKEMIDAARKKLERDQEELRKLQEED